MIKFSKKVEYALISLADMSQKISGELTTARELSEKYDISLELMGKLLQKLAQGGLIISTQGVKGGYQLRRKPIDISINKIINIIDGPISMTNCSKKKGGKVCVRQDYCIIKNRMNDIHTKFMSFLDGISLEDFKK